MIEMDTENFALKVVRVNHRLKKAFIIDTGIMHRKRKIQKYIFRHIISYFSEIGNVLSDEILEVKVIINLN